jgi:hypothetical protein
MSTNKNGAPFEQVAPSKSHLKNIVSEHTVPVEVFWHLIAPTNREIILLLSRQPRSQWIDIAHCEWQHLRPHIQAAIIEVLKPCSERDGVSL